MGELNLTDIGLEDLNELKNFAKEKRESRERKQRLEENLNKLFSDPTHGETYKELYNKGGLKEEIDKDPDVLLNPTAFKYALKEAKSRYMDSIKKESQPVMEPVKSSEPLYQTPQSAPVSNETKDEKINLADPKSLLANRDKLTGLKNLKGHMLMLEINNEEAAGRGQVKYR